MNFAFLPLSDCLHGNTKLNLAVGENNFDGEVLPTAGLFDCHFTFFIQAYSKFRKPWR